MNTDIREIRELDIDKLDAVAGGERGEVVIVGCTTPPRSLPPGTIAWNPYIGQPFPIIW